MIFISGFYNSGVSSIAKLFYNNELTCDYLGKCSYLNQLLLSYRYGKQTWQRDTRYFFKTSNNFISFNKFLFNSYFSNLEKYTNHKLIIHYNDDMTDKFIELNELYPDSKFIIVVRDPRDSIALSIDTLNINNVGYLFELYMSSYENFIRYIKENKLINFIIIQYEDLINNSDKIINQLYDFTGLKLSTNKKIEDNNIGRYRYILNYNDIKMISSSEPKLKKLFGLDVFCDDIKYEYIIKNQKDTIETVRHLFENASIDQVISICKSAIEKFPCYEFYKALALVYTEIQDFENGNKYLIDSLSYNNLDSDLFICEGMLYEINLEFGKSLQSFEKAISLNSKSSDAYNHAARILQKLGKFNKSKKYSEKALNLDKSFDDATVTLENTILNEVTSKNHKVFCIGFNRTGSTSMGEAFKILGYNVKGEIKKQEEWMNNKHIDSIKNYILKISENYNAFFHEPWNQFYKDLDTTYPDSKFILTIRDEQSWLKSFYSYFKNSGNDSWTPFLLGNYDVNDIKSIDDDEYFLSKFREHNQNIIDYFKDQPNKLLIFNVFNDDCWDKLCSFLGCNIPNKSFPHTNKGLYLPT